MKKVYQTIPHSPKNGLFGNCFPACIASIMECDIDEVPHFYDLDDERDDPNQTTWEIENKVRKWFFDRNIPFATLAYLVPPDDTDWSPMHLMAQSNPNLYYILQGNTEYDIGHAVVCLGEEIVHDPSGSGIAKPLLNRDTGKFEIWHIDIIGVPTALVEGEYRPMIETD